MALGVQREPFLKSLLESFVVSNTVVTHVQPLGDNQLLGGRLVFLYRPGKMQFPLILQGSTACGAGGGLLGKKSSVILSQSTESV